MLKKPFAVAIAVLHVLLLFATRSGAQNIITASPVVQNFNALGTSPLAPLPPGWRASDIDAGAETTWTSASVFNVSQAVHSGSSIMGGSLISWGAYPGKDRALGFVALENGVSAIPFSNYISKNAILAAYTNETGIALTSVTIAFEIERYQINVQGFTVSLFTSADGDVFTQFPAADVTSDAFVPATGPSSFNFSSPPSVARTVTVTGLNIPAGGTLYLKWLFTTETYAQGVGLDNVLVSPGGMPALAATLTSTISPANAVGMPRPGDQVRYTGSISNTGTVNAVNISLLSNQPQGSKATITEVLNTSALAVDDYFSTGYNTSLSSGNLLSNDFGLPALKLVSYGTNGNETSAGNAFVTINGGIITASQSGSFVYTPAPGFTGVDRFKYVATTLPGGRLPNGVGSVLIYVKPELTVEASQDEINCYGASDGEIVVYASGGSGEFEYSANNGGSFQASNSFPGLAAGTYTIVIRDSEGRTATTNIVLANPSAIAISKAIANNPCRGQSAGTITITATGGTGPLQYSKNNGATYQSSNVFTNLAAGTYSIVVRDGNGCTASTSAVLTDPQTLVVNGSIPQLIYNTAMTANFTTTGGTGSKTWIQNGLPGGLSIDAATGMVSGSPTETGTFTTTIRATDVNGCIATSTLSVKVGPKTGSDSYTGLIGNTQLVVDGYSSPTTPVISSAVNILANDQSDKPITIVPVTNATTSANGKITISADGKFIYSPPVGTRGSDIYEYTAVSNGVPTQGTINLTIANYVVWYVNNTYAGASGSSDGTSARPYTDLASVVPNMWEGQYIYVHTGSGSTTGNIALKDNQRLVGAGAGFAVLGLSIPVGIKPTLSGTITLANSVIVQGFDMNTGSATALKSNGVTGLSVTVGNLYTTGSVNAGVFTNSSGNVVINGGTQANASGSVFSINGGGLNLTYKGDITQESNAPVLNVTGGHTGTVLFQGATNISNGTGLQFNAANGSYSFSGSVAMNGGDAGIDILNSAGGRFSFNSSTSIAEPSGAAIYINGGTGTFTYNGTISKTATSGKMMDIQNRTSGTISFAGSITGYGANEGIHLVSNAGSYINFTGGITLNGVSSVFSATGGGTISVAGTSNSIGAIVPPTSTALEVTNTTIASGHINFNGISATGGSYGIILNNTGTLGGLKIAGIGSFGSGGTIKDYSMDGISLKNTRDVSLNNMVITNTTSGSYSGIKGTGVVNFQLTYCTFDGSGHYPAFTDARAEEANIHFGTSETGTESNLSGVVTISGNNLYHPSGHGIDIRNFSGSISNLTISGNNIISGSTAANVGHSKGHGIRVRLLGSATTSSSVTKASVINNYVTNFPNGSGIYVQGGNNNAAGPGGNMGTPGSATDIINITGNIITGESSSLRVGSSAIFVSMRGGNASSRSTGNFNISSNGTADDPLANIAGTVIDVSNNGNATTTAAISSNVIVANHQANLSNASGIRVSAGIVAGCTASCETPDLTASILNNTVSNTDSYGISVTSGSTISISKISIRNNNVSAPLSTSSRSGIYVASGNSAAGTDDAICLDIYGNTSAASGTAKGIGLRKEGTSATIHDFGIKGLTGTGSPDVETYVNAQNPAGGGTFLYGALTGFSNCNTSPARTTTSGINIKDKK